MEVRREQELKDGLKSLRNTQQGVLVVLKLWKEGHVQPALSLLDIPPYVWMDMVTSSILNLFFHITEGSPLFCVIPMCPTDRCLELSLLLYLETTPFSPFCCRAWSWLLLHGANGLLWSPHLWSYSPASHSVVGSFLQFKPNHVLFLVKILQQLPQTLKFVNSTQHVLCSQHWRTPLSS